MAKANTQTASGDMESPQVMLLSEAAKQLTAKQLDGGYIVIVIPDTGKAKFSPSHLIATGKQAGKMSKATFIISELGSSFAGADLPFTQGTGNVEGLPLSVKLSIIATPPNRDGKSVEEALKTSAQVEAELKAHNDSVDAQRGLKVA